MSDLVFDNIEITNFKSFIGKHMFKLNRGPGLFYVSGKNKAEPELGANGVGKSTLFDALLWCLDGKTGRDNRPANSIIPWGLEGETTEVSLNFSFMKRSSQLTRTRNPNSLSVTSKDKEREIEQKDVPQFIGMSNDMVRRSIILSQSGTLFMDLRPEEQSRMFSEALNLEVYLKASTLAGQKYRDLVKQHEKKLTDVSQTEGRKSQLIESLRTAKADASSYDKVREEQLQKLEKELTKLEQELESTIFAISRTKGQAKAKGGWLVAATLQPLFKAARAAQRALAQNKSNAYGQARALSAQDKDLGVTLAKYAGALATNNKCPSCGQATSKEHLREKLEQTDKERKCIEKQLSEVEATIDKTEKKLAEADEETLKLERAFNKATKLEAEITSVKKQKIRLENEANPHEASVEEYRGKLKTVKQRHAQELEEAEALSKEAERHAYWQNAFKEIRLGLIDSVLSELDMAVTKNAEALGLIDWRAQFQTERVTVSGNVSLSFTVMLYPPGKEEPVKWESYSGGESQRWQLAVAFGLSEIILARAGVNPKLMVLDEPTKGLSTEGVNTLLEFLQERAISQKQTIYIVEHHSLDKGLFNGVISIEKTAKGSQIKELT